MTAEDSGTLGAEIDQLRSQLEEEQSRRFVQRFVEAAQGGRTLKPEKEKLRAQLTEANEARDQERSNLQAEIEDLREKRNQESSKSFLRRLFGLCPRPQEDTEQDREKMRERLAIRLLWSLIAVVVGTYAYIWISELNPNGLNTVVPMVGTTLLTPLIGLIGAVMGFYYGGQTPVQAASQNAEATKTATQVVTAVQSATAAQYTAATADQKPLPHAKAPKQLKQLLKCQTEQLGKTLPIADKPSYKVDVCRGDFPKFSQPRS
jgi:hypothetical protein